MDINSKLLEKIVNCISPSGNEENIRSILEEEVKDLVDDIYTDPLGNLIAHKKGFGKKFMLAAHMDEIGMMITSIDKNGFLKFCSLGYNNPLILIGQRVIFPNGMKGVISHTGMKEHCDFEFNDLFIDIGVRSKVEAERLVGVGDVCVLDADYHENGNFLIGRTMDDRIGCYILLELIKSQIKTDYDVYYVFTVQEEVGTIGSKTSAFSIAPDLGIAVDVVSVGDIPVGKGFIKQLPVKLGGGPSVRYKDGYIVSDKKFVKDILQIAKDNDIKCQVDILLNAGTDAASIQQEGEGAISTCVNIPTRYIHSPNEIVSSVDVINTIKLLKIILEEYEYYKNELLNLKK